MVEGGEGEGGVWDAAAKIVFYWLCFGKQSYQQQQLRIRQRMLSSKRRPTTSVKHSSKSKIESASVLTHKRLPTAHDLIGRKYYLPVLQEDERHRAFQITKFIAGLHSCDGLGLAEVQKLYSEQEWLTKYHVKPHEELQQTIYDHFNREDALIIAAKTSSMHYYGFAFYLLLENHRKMRELALKRSFAKKESQRSTDYSSKKEINVLGTFSNILKQKQQLNESHELNKLSKCLKNVLKKHDKSKNYKAFLEDMQRRKAAKESEKSEGLLQLILNLEKDFSSIHQETPNNADFSKESIYGLSDLKKKSDKNQSKLEPNKAKDKDKRPSTNFALCKMDFARKLRDVQKTSKGASNSKNSRKSTSVRSKKGNTNTPSTPDNHHHNSKSKSRSKKISLKPATEKKSKLTDTERLYFDDGPEKNQEKQQTKSSLLREGVKKGDNQSLKSKKKLLVKR